MFAGGGEEQQKAGEAEEFAANHELTTQGWDWERQEVAFIIMARGWGGKKRGQQGEPAGSLPPAIWVR